MAFGKNMTCSLGRVSSTEQTVAIDRAVADEFFSIRPEIDVEFGS